MSFLNISVYLIFYVFFTGFCVVQAQEDSGHKSPEKENNAEKYLEIQAKELPEPDSVLESYTIDNSEKTSQPEEPQPAAADKNYDDDEDEKTAYEDYSSSWAQKEDLEYPPRTETQGIEFLGGMSTTFGENNKLWKWGPNFGANIVVPVYYVLHFGVGVNYVQWDLDKENVVKDIESKNINQLPFLLAEGYMSCFKITPFIRLQSVSEVNNNKLYLDLGGGIYYTHTQQEFSGFVPLNISSMDQIAGNNYSDHIAPGFLCGGGVSTQIFEHVTLVFGPEFNYAFSEPEAVMYLLIKGGLQINLKLY